MKLLVHYYEGANFFQRTERQVEADLEEVSVQSIIEKVSEVETDQHLELERVHESIRGPIFKRIRRILPVTGARFDWEGLKLMQ